MELAIQHFVLRTLPFQLNDASPDLFGTLRFQLADEGSRNPNEMERNQTK